MATGRDPHALVRGDPKLSGPLLDIVAIVVLASSIDPQIGHCGLPLRQRFDEILVSRVPAE